MRGLIIALVAMIVLVAAGTGFLVFLRLQSPPDEPPTTKAEKPKPKPTGPTESLPTSKPAETNNPDRLTPAKAEELPPRPVLSAKSKVTALDKSEQLFLEVGENGQKRVLFVGEVCLRGGVFLEVFCCKKDTKEHESILNVNLDARLIHAALLGAGAKVGKPVQFVDPKSLEADYKPASGQRVRVEVCLNRGGKVVTELAQEWILDQTTKKPMAHEWVFAGSRFVQDPDRPSDPPYYTANNGEVIALSNFVDSMLDLPVAIGREDKDLHFKAVEKKVPPIGSKVWVILTPVAEEEKKDGKK
ncbi:MAG: YdjY domain-containing protein [Fimbriiglobus sp.]|nr:YdjY domain-containing protein [Fimbriiglobus sp.]